MAVKLSILYREGFETFNVVTGENEQPKATLMKKIHLLATATQLCLIGVILLSVSTVLILGVKSFRPEVNEVVVMNELGNQSDHAFQIETPAETSQSSRYISRFKTKTIPATIIFYNIMASPTSPVRTTVTTTSTPDTSVSISKAVPPKRSIWEELKQFLTID